MNTSEKLCLNWNNFKESISQAFGDLRKDKDLSDVTLACEDGQQVEAHKVVLIASSPFFLNILKRNKHPHPLIYMKGVKSENLSAMVDFFYHGEANVSQESLKSFLTLAEELHVSDLIENQIKQEVFPPSEKETDQSRSPISKHQLSLKKDESFETGIVQDTFETTVALATDPTTNNTDIASLNQRVKSMMMSSDNPDRPPRICKVCGIETSWNTMRNHIEANHITGISIPCDLCGKSFKSRNCLSAHKSQQHRKIKI